MSFFFSKENKEEIIALFDIGSGSVGGAIILASKKGAPTMLASFRRNFKLRNSVSAKEVKKEMLSALGEVAAKIQKTVHAIPDKVYATLSYPWSRASFRKIKHSQKEGFVFTEKEAKRMIKDEISRFQKENSGFEEIIDRRVTNILLNGFELKNPHGKRAKECEIQIFLSLADSEIVDKIEDVIMKTYHRNIKFTSQMFANFVVVRDIFDNVDDFTIIDVDEEITEVSVMVDDNLLGTETFFSGKNTFIKKVSESLKKDIKDTVSLISLYKDSHLHDSRVGEVELAVRNANKEWMDDLKKTLTTLFYDLLIPHNIFLICDSNAEKFYSNLLQKGNFPEFTTTKDSFNVIISGAGVLRDFCKMSYNVRQDPNLIIQSIYINKINF
jgi:cell division ATPase FtsA